jgi:hypothetical protein
VRLKQTLKQLQKIDKEKAERLLRVIKLIGQYKRVLFIDEAVFTTRSVMKKVWANNKEQAWIIK